MSEIKAHSILYKSRDKYDRFNCISINYKLCDKNFRSLFTFSDSAREKLLFSAGDKSPVLLCTCNRTELYCFGSISAAIKLLSDNIADHIDPEELKRRLMIFSGEGAVKHLFSVACGIESMVIGEDEILGQIKSAYAYSKERIALSAECNMIFQSAVTTAKRIKTETELSKTSVSTATLAAKCAAKLCENVTVMLIGASGKIGTSLLKDLLSYKNVKVLATSRSHNREFELASENPSLEIIPYDKRYDYINRCDCVISATTSPHFTLTADRIRINAADEKMPKLFIDLAVPNDIDPAVTDKGAKLVDIDYFSKLAEENNAQKLDSVERAKAMIEEDMDELKKQLAFHSFLLRFSDVEADLESLSAKEFFFKLKSELSGDAFLQVIKVIDELNFSDNSDKQKQGGK